MKPVSAALIVDEYDHRYATMTYDALNRLEWKQDQYGMDLDYHYWPTGELKELYSAAAGGNLLAWAYDADGRQASNTDYAGTTMASTYNKRGQRTVSSSTLNSRVQTLTYDASGRNTGSIDAIGATTLQRFTYTFDANGNRETIQDLNGSNTTYAYDPKDRLTGDNTSGTSAHVYTYTWDSRDNILTSDETGTTATHTYDAASRLTNTVEGSDTTDYTYDDNGNLRDVAGPIGMGFEYTPENQLLSVKGDAEASYVYDCFGHRREDTVSGETLELYWHDGNYLGERNAYVSAGVLSKLFATTNGQITGFVEGDLGPLGAYLSGDYLLDFLGSVTGEVDALASLSGVRRFKPSGEKVSGALVFRGPGFTGASGSRHTMVPFADQYNEQRVLSTRLMQWITRDPLWPHELPYGYVNGNPTTWIDPSGLISDACASPLENLPSDLAGNSWPLTQPWECGAIRRCIGQYLGETVHCGEPHLGGHGFTGGLLQGCCQQVEYDLCVLLETTWNDSKGCSEVPQCLVDIVNHRFGSDNRYAKCLCGQPRHWGECPPGYCFFFTVMFPMGQCLSCDYRLPESEPRRPGPPLPPPPPRRSKPRELYPGDWFGSPTSPTFG